MNAEIASDKDAYEKPMMHALPTPEGIARLSCKQTTDVEKESETLVSSGHLFHIQCR